MLTHNRINFLEKKKLLTYGLAFFIQEENVLGYKAGSVKWNLLKK
jgi:hypothetical protein